ncbi:hypothetical protein [Pseudomonas viridiflava]|uniref:hypothetical protein n=1 Tax=Pseudomonas viridiflava TaxID=33069 RepID=UPI001C31CA3E|nr:hypothetical protein [Pseudomonas viridiflava]QXG49965.1 hypothetical protein KTT57_13475 [Pseudomonas viridiflava]
MFIKTIPLILALAALAAGPALAHDDGAAPAEPAPIARDPATGAALQLKPPRPDSIMYYISRVDGNGDLSYPTVNGSWINYWYGFQFELNGTLYYTGFVWETPDKYGAGLENDFPAPDTKVTMAHATFVTSQPGSKSPWLLQGVEPYIGEFGGSERGNEVDTTREPQTWNTPSGDMLLALPTWYLVSGERMRTIEILLFHPQELSNTDDKWWTYLATLEAGFNNEANCGPDSASAIPCGDTTGKLEFIAQKDSDLPLLRVTVPAAGSQPETVNDYKYDAVHKVYELIVQ